MNSRMFDPLSKNHLRKMKFGIVGVLSLLVSFGSLYIMIHSWQWNPSASYAIQTVLAIEVNFVLNYFFTWRDREGTFWARFLRFHIARMGLMIPLNQVLFYGFDHITNYYVANAVCVGLTMVVNWFLNDRWTFRVVTESVVRSKVATAIPETPLVSVVIPARNSGDDVGECVESILAQTYKNLEVIVVGNVDDSSWGPLRPMAARDSRLRLVGVSLAMGNAVRDANAKRRIGLQRAGGDILALTDSDMILDPTWLSDGLALLRQGHDVVASGMISTADSYLGKYIDNNRVGSRTPDLVRTYMLASDNYGRRNHKPPVTANLLLRREVYEDTGGPDPRFTNSYEDYEWARRIIDAGFAIFYTPTLSGHHHHRSSLQQMMKDYRRAGRGCANYIRTHPSCRLARNRLMQAMTIPVLAVIAIVLADIDWLDLSIAIVLSALIVTGMSVVRTRSVVAATYPLVTFLVGLNFWFGLVSALPRRGSLVAPVVLDVDHNVLLNAA